MSPLREPRSAVIFEHTRQAFRHSPMKETTFTSDVVTHYDKTVDPRWRVVRWHHDGEVFDCMKANCQIMRRFLNGEVRMPCDLEESWVAALPQPWRQECRRALAERIGRLDVKVPATEDDGATVETGALLKEVGEAIQSLAPVMSQGGLAKMSHAEAQVAMHELSDVLAQCIRLQRHLSRVVLGVNPVTELRKIN